MVQAPFLFSAKRTQCWHNSFLESSSAASYRYPAFPYRRSLFIMPGIVSRIVLTIKPFLHKLIQ